MSGYQSKPYCPSTTTKWQPVAAVGPLGLNPEHILLPAVVICICVSPFQVLDRSAKSSTLSIPQEALLWGLKKRLICED